MPDRPPCYGNLLPDLGRLADNTPCRGKALVAQVATLGIGVQSRLVTVDSAQWEACQRCPDYRSCYDLSMALFAVREGLARR